jgi:3-hydroxyacyl-[acyl-carrier-protein] dehydratase
MILQGDFYTIENLQVDGNTVQAGLHLNAKHLIYEGHFPGQPVTPGVCMMQMIKEIIETVLSHKTRLVRADEMKFLRMIIPGEENLVHAKLTYVVDENDIIKVSASLLKDDVIHFKFKGSFRFE